MSLSNADGSATRNGVTADSLLEGLVTDGARGQYRVTTPDGVLLCTLRGRLRKELLVPISPNLRHKARRASIKARDPLAAGDRVRVLPMGAGRGRIEAVLPREGGAFERDDPDAGRATSVAGVDQLLAVFAARDPSPHLGLLDRFLVVGEAQRLGVAICLNKIDLGVDPELQGRLDYYGGLGYPVVRVSAASGAGLDGLRGLLAGRTSALLGPSGVGKSSLLNAVEPGLGLAVSEVSGSTHKGRHTTSGTRVVPLAGPAGGSVADTAGIRALAVGGAAPGELDWCFRELRPFLGGCYHADCTHRSEPGCAVRQAVDAGELDRRRYESYVRLHAEGAGTRGRAWRSLVSSASLAGEGEFRM